MKEHIQCYDAYAPLPQLQRCIREGHSVLVLMRGVPGSGKSHLARELLALREGGSIFSTDDFFMKNGEYQFKQEMLEEYHKKNILKARDAMKDSVTPVIIDNTNILATHMKQYIVHAVANYYEIYIVEPTTAWCRRAGECARRNVHGVSKEKIVQMIDQMDIEQDPPLASLIGKDRQIRLDPRHDEEEEMDVQLPPSTSTAQKATSFGLFSMGAPLCVATAPSAPIFSMAPPPVSPTVTTKMRDVSTGDNEVTIILSAVGFKDMFDDNFFAGEEYKKETILGEKVEMKDRPSPLAIEAKNRALVEASDLDLLVSIFPTECMATIQHYYQTHGLVGIIKIFCEMGIMPDLEAEVKEGVFNADIARALQTGSCEPDFVDFPAMGGNGNDSEAQTSTSDSEFSQPLAEEKLYIDLGEALCTQLQHLFGPTGSNSSSLAMVSKSALKKLYDDWISSNCAADVAMTSSVDEDEAFARRMHEEEVRRMNETTNKPKMTFNGAQHLQLQSLFNDFPGFSQEALTDFYIANGMSATNTRAMLQESAHNAPQPSVSNRVIQPSAFANSATTRTTSNGQKQQKLFPGERVMRDDFAAAHREVLELMKDLKEIREKKNAVLEKAYQYHPLNQRGMNVVGAVYTQDARKWGRKETELREQINDILTRANRRSDYLDLHYFTQQEALRMLKERLSQCDRDGPNRGGNGRRLSVVTGYGKNNSGKNVIKAAVIAHLKSQGYKFSQANMGEIIVTCK